MSWASHFGEGGTHWHPQRINI